MIDLFGTIIFLAVFICLCYRQYIDTKDPTHKTGKSIWVSAFPSTATTMAFILSFSALIILSTGMVVVFNPWWTLGVGGLLGIGCLAVSFVNRDGPFSDQITQLFKGKQKLS